MIVVSNASPLISLAKIHQLELIHKLFSEISITPDVFSEAATTGTGAKDIAMSKWIKVTRLNRPALLLNWRSQYRLGVGELSTILLAKELSADLAIIDERKARALAQEKQLPVVGSVGILEEAFRRHYISDLRICYQKLLETGTYIDPRLLNLSLASFGLQGL